MRRFRSYSHGLAPFAARDGSITLSLTDSNKVVDDLDHDGRLVGTYINTVTRLRIRSLAPLGLRGPNWRTCPSIQSDPPPTERAMLNRRLGAE